MPSPDRALNRLIVQLSRQSEADVMAILENLDAAERSQVETLLEELRVGSALPDPPAVPPGPAYDITRLSPWLAERLEASDAITPQARQILMDCATRLYPMPKAPSQERSARSFLGFASSFRARRQAG